MLKWDLPPVFTTRDVIKHGNLSDRAVRGYLSELAKASYIDLVEAGRGRQPHVWRLCDASELEARAVELPRVESLLETDSFRASDKTQVHVNTKLQPEAMEIAGDSG